MLSLKKMKLWVIAGLAATSLMAEDAPEKAKPAKDYFSFCPEVVAEYDGGKITKQDIKNKLEFELQRVVAAGQDIPEDKLKEACVGLTNYLVEMKVLAKKAVKLGYEKDMKAAGAEADKAKDKYGEEQFNMVLKAQGMTKDQLVDQIAVQNQIQKMIEKEVGDKIEVDDKAVKKFYDENKATFSQAETLRASHILAKCKFSDEEAAKAAKVKIDGIMKQLKDGKDFAKLAEENSDCPSGKNGGDLGEFQKGRMVPAFEEAVLKLKENEISDIVKTQFGYHIIKAGKNTPARQKELAEVSEDIKNQLKEQQFGTKVKEMVDSIREEYKVKILLTL